MGMTTRTITTLALGETKRRKRRDEAFREGEITEENRKEQRQKEKRNRNGE